MTTVSNKKPIDRRRYLKLLAKLTTALLLAGLFLAAGLFLLIRFGLTGSHITGFVFPRLEDALGKRIACTSADVSWTTSVTGTICIRDVKILNQAGTILLTHIPEAVFDIDLTPLLKGIISLDKATFLRPTFFLYGPNVGSDSTESARLFPSSAVPILPRILHLELTDGSLVYSDSPENPQSGRTVFSKIHCEATGVTPSGFDRISLTGMAPQPKKEGSLEISGGYSENQRNGGASSRIFSGRIRAVGVPLNAIKKIASCYDINLPFSEGSIDFTAALTGNGQLWEASGNLELSNAHLKQGKVFARDTLLKKAGTNFSLRRESNSLLLDLTEVSLPGINLSLAGKLENVSDPDPVVTLSVQKADLDLEKIFPLMPLNLLPQEDRARLIDAGLKGHVVLKKGSWTGTFGDISKKLNHQGTLELVALLDKVSGFFPGLGLPVSNATGEISLNSDELVFRGISLDVGNSPIVLNGWIASLKNFPRVDLFVSMKADAQDLRPLLDNRIVAARLGTLAEWFNDPGGNVSVTMDLKGKLERPEMKGRINFDDFQCSPRKLPFPLKKINGSIRFRSGGTTFSDIKGLLGSSPFVVKGSIQPDNIEITGELKLSPADLKKFDSLPSSLAISGHIPISVNVKGSLSQIMFSSALDFKGNTVTVGQILDKKAGTPLRVELSGTRDASGFNVDDASVLLEHSRVSAKANIKEDGKVTVIVNLPPKGIPTATLTAYFHPILEMQPGGRIEGDSAISFGNASPLNVEANLLFSHLSLRLPGMHKRSEGLTGSLKQRVKSLQLNLERGRVGSSLISGTMSVSDFDNPKLEVAIESSFLETADFTAPPGYVHRLTWGEYIRSNPVVRFLARSKGTGYISVAKGKTGARTFSDFRANLEGNGGLIRVSSWQANFADGVLRGTALFDIGTNTSKPLVVDFHGDALKMERMIVADPAWLRVSGDFTSEGHLEWNLGTSSDGRGLYKTGRIDVRMNDGVINRFDILSKLFSLVNLGSLLRGRLPDLVGKGLPFHRLTWNMEVYDNKWKIKDLKLLSDAARVDSFGMYFGGQERVDFRMDVSPLVGFDAILSGLFGNLFTRDGKILTTTFRIRGLYTSPDIRLEPFENLKSSP